MLPVKFYLILITCIFALSNKFRDTNYNDNDYNVFRKSYAMINPLYLPPSTNQYSRGSCWLFTMTRILEAAYVRNGLKKGYLNENEWIHFSEQALGIGIMKHCADNSEPYCVGGPQLNTTEGGFPINIFYMQDWLYNYVYPAASCGYDPSNDAGIYECFDTPTSFDDLINIKPLTFKNNINTTVYNNWRDVYNRIIETEGDIIPMAIGTPLFGYNVYIMTGSESESLIDSRQLKRINNTHSFVQVMGWFNGDFVYQRGTNTIGGHAMIVAGINKGGYANEVFQKNPGVIALGNSWGRSGWTPRFVLNDNNIDSEIIMCDATTPYIWVSFGMHLSCNKCSMTVNKNDVYVIEKMDSVSENNALMNIYGHHYYYSSYLDRVVMEEFNITNIDYYLISTSFKPIGFSSENIPMCTYYGMPLEYLDRARYYNINEYEIEFDDSAYVVNMDCDGDDNQMCEWIKSSTVNNSVPYDNIIVNATMPENGILTVK